MAGFQACSQALTLDTVCSPIHGCLACPALAGGKEEEGNWLCGQTQASKSLD